MVGLRVLRRHGGRYGLRSPYIIQMLGTRKDLEQELLESAQHLERPLEYNPTMARQIIGDSTRIWSPRSPLTDNDLALLVGPNPESSVQVVFGTEALGVDRVAGVLEAAAKVNGFEVVPTTIGDAFELDKRQFGKPTHVVLDLTAAQTNSDLGAVCASLTGRRNLTASIVVGPRWLSHLDALSVPVHKLRRWSITGLRSWYDTPFEELKDRERLYRVTCGWPRLVEEVMMSYARGKSADEALEALTARLAQKDQADSFLKSCAVDHGVASTWAEWLVRPSEVDELYEAEPATAADLSVALGRDVYSVLSDLETLDVVTQRDGCWTLDRVVAAAAKARK